MRRKNFCLGHRHLICGAGRLPACCNLTGGDACAPEKRCSLSTSNRVPCWMIHPRLCAPTIFALALVFYSLLTTGFAAPAETSPPPVTPTPEARPSVPTAPSTIAATPSKAVENSVVKIFATLRQPDPTKPWTKKEPNDITASGVVISGKRILTNAHVVQYAS